MSPERFQDSSSGTWQDTSGALFAGPLTVRRQIVYNFGNRMITILTANGYTTDVGAHVYYNRTTNIPVSLLPAMTFKDGEGSVDVGPQETQDRTVTIEVKAFATADNTVLLAEALDELEGDIEAAVASDETWSSLAEATELIGTVQEIEHKEHLEGSTTMTFRIEFRTIRFDPYTRA